MRKTVIDIAGAILAGGKNSRMGGLNKALIEIDGTAIVRRLIGLFKDIFEEVVLITNSPNDYKAYAEDVIITPDLIKDVGPLGGIYAGLNRTAKEAVFFVACDMPFMHNAFIKEEIDRFKRAKSDCLVPRIGSLMEPLCAVYRKELKNNLCSFINSSKDHSIKSFLRTINVSYWDLEDNPANRKIFSNLNTPQDLKRVKDEL